GAAHAVAATAVRARGLAVRHALDRHHDPLALLLDARTALSILRGQTFLPQRDGLEHVVVGADQLAHGITPPSMMAPRALVGVRTNSWARGRRAVTHTRSLSSACDSSHSSATTCAGPSGSAPIATAGPQYRKRIGASPARCRRSYAPGCA